MNISFRKKIVTLSFFMIFLCVFNVFSNEESYSWDFSDCEIKDILFSVSLDTGITIVPDDTVMGKGDFQFAGGDFEGAFDSFLRRCRLYVNKEKNIWTVSKFNFSQKDGLYYIDAYDMYPADILEKLAERAEWYITYDSLPNIKLSIHFKGINKNQLVKNLSNYFGNYEIEEVNNNYHLASKKIQNHNYENLQNNIEISVNGNPNSYLINVKESDFFGIIDKLFETGKNNGDNYNFCILSNNNNTVSRTFLNGSDFVTTLNIICNQNGYKTIFADNIYYIVTDSDIKSDLLEGAKKWIRFPLAYISTDEIIPLLEKKIGKLEIIPILDKTSFLCKCNGNEEKLINSFISQVDIKKTLNLINLKYIKPEELLEFLPPNINKSNLFVADNNSQLYFRGTDEAYKNILDQIKIVDKPVTRISYDLLILQCDENMQNTWASSIGAKRLKYGESSNMTAMLGSVMGFNLNIVGAFGVKFAAELQASLEENSTRVFADTTLHGVSGKKISFQNTNTYRYRDNNVDPENGKPIYSGITKEIVTGIKIDVMGWVSGDGMITSTVTASISRQGIDTSGSSGNPPPTSEKLVTTEVTGKSGEPVVLSGLLLSAESEGEKRSPFISKIPIIGNLFKNKNKTKENSQMIIYLVPHIENNNTEETKENYYSDEWFEDKITKIMEKIKES